MKNVKEFLDLCHRRFPSPRPDQRHSICLEGDGLIFTLMLGDTSQQFDLTNEDLQKSPIELLTEIVALMKNPAVPNNPNDCA